MSKVFRAHEKVPHQRWTPEALQLATEITIVEEVVDAPIQIPIETPDPREEAVQEAARMLQAASAEAAEICAAAEQESQVIRQQAYQDGFGEGREVGQQLYQAKRAELEQLIAGISDEREEYFQQAEPEMVRLATAIAEKILERQLTLDANVILDLVRSHIRRIRDRGVLTIHLNPDDLPIIAEACDNLRQEIGGISDLSLVEDQRVDRGGMIIEAPSGAFDARFSTKLGIIERAIAKCSEVSDERQDR